MLKKAFAELTIKTESHSNVLILFCIHEKSPGSRHNFKFSFHLEYLIFRWLLTGQGGHLKGGHLQSGRMCIAVKHFLTTNINLGKQKRSSSVSLSIHSSTFYLQLSTTIYNYRFLQHHYHGEQVSHHHNCFIILCLQSCYHPSPPPPW